MRYILNESTNPYYNLALDEYALRHVDVDEDFFILWQNEPSVIVGKNQNTLQEIHKSFTEKEGIHIARRVSGGGAVYHDLGNLTFTFISHLDDVGTTDFKKYVQPIIDALHELGIEAKATGRNDIQIGDKKISGNAQRQANGKLMHHGTLLFDVNIENMVAALNATDEKFLTKAAKSVRSRVTNIKEHLPPNVDIQTFSKALHQILSKNNKDDEIILTPEQKAEIQHEADSRFNTWEWIYGASPEFTFHQKDRFDGGTLEVYVNVDEGHIKSIRFLGDYLGVKNVETLENKLQGCRYAVQDVTQVLDENDIKTYFGTITSDEVLSVIFEK